MSSAARVTRQSTTDDVLDEVPEVNIIWLVHARSERKLLALVVDSERRHTVIVADLLEHSALLFARLGRLSVLQV